MADSGKDFPAGLSEEASRCPRCGAKLAKGAKRCRYGHALTKVEEAVVDPLDRRVEEAIAAIKPPKLGGIGKFDTKLHPHDRVGKFARTFHAPKVGHHVMDVSSGLPKRAVVTNVHASGAVDVQDEKGTKRLEPHQYHGADADAPKPKPKAKAKVPKNETPEDSRKRQRDEAWPPTEGVHPDLAGMRYSGPKAGPGHYTVRMGGQTFGGQVKVLSHGPKGSDSDKAAGHEPYYIDVGNFHFSGRSVASVVKQAAEHQHAEWARNAERDKHKPPPRKSRIPVATHKVLSPKERLASLEKRRVEVAAAGNKPNLLKSIDAFIKDLKKQVQEAEVADRALQRRVDHLLSDGGE